MKKILDRKDFVAFYARQLIKDPSLFDQQKRFIESQMDTSHQLFRKKFGRGKQFKVKARKYLKELGLI